MVGSVYPGCNRLLFPVGRWKLLKTTILHHSAGETMPSVTSVPNAGRSSRALSPGPSPAQVHRPTGSQSGSSECVTVGKTFIQPLSSTQLFFPGNSHKRGGTRHFSREVEPSLLKNCILILTLLSDSCFRTSDTEFGPFLCC